ncbi:MAG: hypothetical protein ABSF98_27290 [Bryobacteraceae bacterium]|jgi:hypothetical protein
MAQFREAVYTNDVLKPSEQLVLREADRGDGRAALQQLLAGIEGMRFFSRGRYPLETNFMIALDTNILIYACDKADTERQQVGLDLVSNAGDRCPHGL